MPIAQDWKIDEANLTISHIDGILVYGSGSGVQPAVGEYVIGATSGAIGKILEETGDETSGTFTITNVLGQFSSGESLDHLSKVDFDGVGNGGFEIGDTIVDQVTGTIDVKFIEYNIDGTAGHGTIYGTNMSAFTNNSQLDISGGQSAVGLADGTGTDNDTAFDAALTGALRRPGYSDNSNKSIIVHYDGGTIDIPEDARISDQTTGAEGYAQRVVGNTTTGSVRIIDYDTDSGTWTNNNNIDIEDVVHWDNPTAGKVFAVGDIVKGSVSGATGRVLAVIDDGDSTGKIILADASGTWNAASPDLLQVLQADDTYDTYAECENTTHTLAAAVLNLPSGVRDEQRASQGGLYPSTDGLNVIRSYNAFYTYLFDTFDELNFLDDEMPMEGKVGDQLYIIINDYIIPDLSFRFLEKGSCRDSGKNNIWVNIRTDGSKNNVGNHGYLYDSTNPTPQPNLRIVQDGSYLDQFYLEGDIDILVKVKTSTDPKYIDPNSETIGQLIDSGDYEVHLREYLSTYATAARSKPLGGVDFVGIQNEDDLNNTTGTHRMTYSAGGTFSVGEEIIGGTSGAIGIVTDENVGTSVDYVLKTPGTDFSGTETVTGQVSSNTCTRSGGSALVSGYSTDIRIMVVTDRIYDATNGTQTGTFTPGELVTQAVSGATGYLMADEGDAGGLYLEHVSGTFNNTGTLTGGVSSATYSTTGTFTLESDQDDFPYDLLNGDGNKNYTGGIACDITGASPQTVQEMYEYLKYRFSVEVTTVISGHGDGADTPGNQFRRLDPTFAEVTACPAGIKAGDLFIGAQGWAVYKDELDSADIRNIKLFTNTNEEQDPPNLQSLVFAGDTESGVRVAAYRSTGAGNQDILRTEFDVGAVGGGYNQSGDNEILVGANTRSVSPLPSDVPDTGVLRVLDPNDTGKYLRFPYSSVDRTNNVFTLASGTIGNVTNSQDLVLDDNVHVMPIEEEASGATVSNSIQYIGDIPLYVKARLKGKQIYKAAATFGSGGLTVGVVLNPDDVVNLP